MCRGFVRRAERVHFAWEIADDFVLTGIQGRRRFFSNRFIILISLVILIVFSKRCENGKKECKLLVIFESEKIFKYKADYFK